MKKGRKIKLVYCSTNLAAHDFVSIKLRLFRYTSIVSSQCPILILPSEVGAFIWEACGNHPLYVVSHVVAGFSSPASEIMWKFIQEVYLICRARVHEEVKRIHSLPTSSCCPMKHAHAVRHSHRKKFVGELCEQGGKS